MARFVKRGKKWQYEISYKKADGTFDKIRQGGFPKKSDAVSAAAEIELKLAKGLIVENKDISLYDHFELWMKVFKKGKVSNITYRKYENTLMNIKKYFSDLTLRKTTRTSYQQRLNSFAETHTDSTVERLNMHIRASLVNAVDEGKIAYDFTKGSVTKGQVAGVTEDEKYLNYDDFTRLMNLAKQKLDPRFASRFMIVVGGATGMRFGELLGLTWDYVDLENGYIDIVRAWDYQDTKDFCPPKNPQSVRKVPLDITTLELMKDFKMNQRALFKEQKITNPNNFVFFNAKNGLISHNAALKKLKILQEQLDISPAITLHGLRHTHASVLIFKGVNLLAVSKHLGHKSLNVTMSTYAHAIKELQEQEDEKLRAVMDGIFEEETCAKSGAKNFTNENQQVLSNDNVSEKIA